MPVIFKIQNKEYSYPQGWQDVTLEKWLKSLDIQKPEVLKTLYRLKTQKEREKHVVEKITPIVYSEKVLPYYMQYVNFWTGVSEAEMMSLKIGQLEQLYKQIETNLNRSTEAATKDTSDTIQHAGRVYYLPTQHLKKGTVSEFIEAAQAEHLAKQLEGNQLKAIPKLLCIFLKTKKDAPYNPKQMEREGLFMSLTMDKVFKVSFFLLKLNERFLQDSLIYTALSHLSQHPHKLGQA